MGAASEHEVWVVLALSNGRPVLAILHREYKRCCALLRDATESSLLADVALAALLREVKIKPPALPRPDPVPGRLRCTLVLTGVVRIRDAPVGPPAGVSVATLLGAFQIDRTAFLCPVPAPRQRGGAPFVLGGGGYDKECGDGEE